MGVTHCYAMVRGSALRVTGLRACGSIPDPVRYAVSKGVVKVTVDEVTESGNSELLRDDRDDPRLHFAESDKTIRYVTGVEFLRVDPGILSMMTNTPLVLNALGNVVGFDAETKLTPAAFALEVWTRLSSRRSTVPTGVGFGEGGFGEGPFGFGEDGGVDPLTRCLPEYGYTLLPFLKGGSISAFSFSNGTVSFSVKNAATRRSAKWSTGPYVVQDGERLTSEVSGNLMFRQFITSTPPPEQTAGVVEFVDAIDDGFAGSVYDDTVDDGTASGSTPGVINDGNAA